MVNFAFMPVLLCIFSWISSSLTQFYTVEVQPGEDVTLRCSNLSSMVSHVHWFKMTSSPSVSCISSMISPVRNFSFCDDGFQNGKFRMTSNTSVVYLKIKQVDLSDSGLYFCGEKLNNKSVISSGTHLKVLEASDALTNLASVILGGLTVFLLLVIMSLAVKIRRFHTAQDERQNPQHNENVESDAMNYAALSFHPKENFRRAAPHKESHVTYAATR
ncbi:uncharacterized protein LOC115797527 [Archocentrus centrarchus]|uniref:uncharacterized protein LOC115797527 n=1 Tax=Archocentrus centrarchus TaxID=63155 RepID=UPI0011EA1AF0|nr:uncharacterized protein LOC115797527 [Archocentrus centrarchus]